MARPGSARYKDMPLVIAGSTKFGRYPKMSSEASYNLIMSDEWMVPFAGYSNISTISPAGQGRGIYSSSKLVRMFAVIDNNVWLFDTSLTKRIIGKLSTYQGNVFIAENNLGQVMFSDLSKLYVYDDTTSPPSFKTSGVDFTIDFVPGYVTFQNGRFVSPAADLANVANNFLWRLSSPNDGTSWPGSTLATASQLSQFQGALQTKPDKCVATIRFPGRGNMLLVFGATVTEQWYDIGAQLFPYQRSQSSNIDYGCLNAATIAESENIVAWVAANEKSGPVISFTNGGEIKHISTDGIDFKLANLTDPTNCYGFMFKQDGHLFYVASWPTDKQSYAYDFNTDKFFTLSDENLDAFIAKKVVFFNNKYYFISIRDGNLYQLSSDLVTYDYGNDNVFEIPRIRVTPSIEMPDQSRFMAGYSGFTVEQGQFDYNDVDTTFILGTQNEDEISTQDHGVLIGGGYDYRNNVPRIDMAVSKDGGVTYGSYVSNIMQPLGRRANKMIWWRLGASNTLVHQFRFYGFGRFVAYNGVTGITQ